MKTTKEYVEGDQNYLLQVFTKPDYVFESGHGVYLKDIEGKEYLDFIGGIAVNVFGYSDEGLFQTIEQQARKIIHISNLFHNKPQVELAELIIKNTLKKGKLFFSNSGTEANEAAIKFAKVFGTKVKNSECFEIIATHKSFHGRTLGALAVTGQEKFWKNLGALHPGVKFVEYGNIEQIKNAISDKTAAIMLEPIQAEGGINGAPLEFWKELRSICDKNNILLIVDEVQTGTCRTGSLFAWQELGITPDIFTVSKGIGHGYPLGATMVNDKVASQIERGMHGSTLGGQPLACAVGKYVVSKLLNENFPAKVRNISDYFVAQLETLKKSNPKIKAVKGKGLLLGIQMADPDSINEIRAQMMKKGILIGRAGTDVIRFVPPLIIEEKHIDTLISTLSEVLK